MALAPHPGQHRPGAGDGAEDPEGEVDEYLRALAEMAEASGGGIAGPIRPAARATCSVRGRSLSQRNAWCMIATQSVRGRLIPNGSSFDMPNDP